MNLILENANNTRQINFHLVPSFATKVARFETDFRSTRSEGWQAWRFFVQCLFKFVVKMKHPDKT